MEAMTALVLMATRAPRLLACNRSYLRNRPGSPHVLRVNCRGVSRIDEVQSDELAPQRSPNFTRKST